ncbi:MAG: Bax inhibitor-1/YccA family protein [Muribaculaceae bacterium]|nr:Bax inhibitor-1/YccA family protein [Muribaculaceae bacterium]
MNNNDLYPYGSGYSTAAQVENEMSLANYTASVMRRVYGKMFLGLLATAITSFMMLSSESLMMTLLGNRIIFWVLMIAELALVFGISGAINKLSTGTATALFYLYSVLNGVTLTPIFMVYTYSSVMQTFLITSVTFGAMTAFGYFTKQDLTKFGSFLFMALIGLIVCSIINLFMHSSTFEWIISLAGVAIFIGLTAWDTQKIKEMTAMTDPSQVGKVATLGALSLYLDFINLFLYLLRFFGSRD